MREKREWERGGEERDREREMREKREWERWGKRDSVREREGRREVVKS